MPSILYGDRRQRRIAFVLTLGFLALAACGRGKAGQTGPAVDPVMPILRAGEPTRRVRVFLIAPGDNGRAGHRVGCGDSAVPVEINLPRPEPALEGALRALLAQKERYQEPSGLSNPLYSSALELVRVERQGAQGADARVYLKGYLEMGGECDNPRILAELQETA
ncbi:MAG TPA: hypothetical protein VGR07_00855, partial [Thermoanaerobaculia bacterium]|nr:hypothetical protein [Thermoanaerobaculia bacterium]